VTSIARAFTALNAPTVTQNGNFHSSNLRLSVNLPLPVARSMRVTIKSHAFHTHPSRQAIPPHTPPERARHPPRSLTPPQTLSSPSAPLTMLLEHGIHTAEQKVIRNAPDDLPDARLDLRLGNPRLLRRLHREPEHSQHCQRDLSLVFCVGSRESRCERSDGAGLRRRRGVVGRGRAITTSQSEENLEHCSNNMMSACPTAAREEGRAHRCRCWRDDLRRTYFAPRRILGAMSRPRYRVRAG
jgi:hypothetical protein